MRSALAAASVLSRKYARIPLASHRHARTCPDLFPGIRASGRAGRDRGVLVDGRDKPGHAVSGTFAFILFSSGTRH